MPLVSLRYTIALPTRRAANEQKYEQDNQGGYRYASVYPPRQSHYRDRVFCDLCEGGKRMHWSILSHIGLGSSTMRRQSFHDCDPNSSARAAAFFPVGVSGYFFAID